MEAGWVYEWRDDPRFYDAPLVNAGFEQAGLNRTHVMDKVPADIVFTSPLMWAI